MQYAAGTKQLLLVTVGQGLTASRKVRVTLVIQWHIGPEGRASIAESLHTVHRLSR
jgi:hypothetical protein